MSNKIYLEPYGLSNISIFVVAIVNEVAHMSKNIVDKQTPVVKDGKELYMFNDKLLEPSQIFTELCDYYLSLDKIGNELVWGE